MNQIPNRNLEVRIMAEGGFSGGDIKIIRDLSILCRIKRLSPPSLDTCDLIIKNMLDADTQVLTTMNYNPSKILKNTLEIFGGESGVFTRVFKGDIIRGAVTYGGDSVFTASCQTNYFSGIKQIPSISLKGRESVTKVIGDICNQAGLTLINNGVSGVFVSDLILIGSAVDQIIEVCKLADLELIFSDNSVKISNKINKKTGNIVIINSRNGLLGFPIIDELGVNVTVKYNRNILIGDIIKVESLHTKANGLWKVFEANLELSNQDTAWFMKVRGRKF